MDQHILITFLLALSISSAISTIIYIVCDIEIYQYIAIICFNAILILILECWRLCSPACKMGE